jgi:hypothetical protein
MAMRVFRRMASCVLLLIFPAASLAADPGAAMLYAHGAAWLNGAHVPASSAIFTGDLLQTRSDSAAHINAPGSSITVIGDSLVQFQGSSVKVEHGGVAIATSKRKATTAGGVLVAPASNAWTEFNVVDTDGTVKIAARKGDLTVTDNQGSVTLAQGQETTREEQTDQASQAPNPSGDHPSGDQSTDDSKKKKKKRAAGAAPAAGGGLLNSTAAIAAGAAAITGVTVWVLTRSDNPVSPSTPN